MSESSDLEVLVDLEILTNDCTHSRRLMQQQTGPADYIKRIITSMETLAQNEDGTDRGSPPPNCAICLGKLKDKSYTDTCLHPFCFKCLLEWSKVKAECPLCKQAFKFIVHNVKSLHQYDQYPVPIPIPSRMSASIPLPAPDPRFATNSLMRQRWHTITNQSFAQLQSRIEVFLNQRNLINDEPIEVYPDNPSGIFLSRAEWLSNFRRDLPNFPPNISNETMNQLWRHYVYYNKLMALPLVDITGRQRDCTAQFYRENPAQIQRLIPFLQRELIELVPPFSGHRIPYVLNTITELLTIHNMSSADFRRRVRPFILNRTNHFVHEFVNFARSPYDLLGYDREVHYANHSEDRVSVLSSAGESDGSDIEHVAIDVVENNSRESQTRRRTGFTIETRANNSRLVMTGTIEDDSDPSVASTSQASAINLSTHNRGENSVAMEPETNEDTSSAQIEHNVVLSSSSDECEFVLERPPPHLRTPELVSLNSGTEDSDCVFIAENKPVLPIKYSSNRLLTLKRPVSRSSHHHLSDYALSDEDSSNNECKETEKKRLKKDKTNSTNTPNERLNPNNVSNIKDEYNNGASTSSGLRSHDYSSLGSSRPDINSRRRKYFARLKMQILKRGNNYKCRPKSIFDNSDTERHSDSSVDDESDESWSKVQKRRSSHNKRKIIKTETKSKRPSEANNKKKQTARKIRRKKVKINRSGGGGGGRCGGGGGGRRKREPSTSSSSSTDSVTTARYSSASSSSSSSSSASSLSLSASCSASVSAGSVRTNTSSHALPSISDDGYSIALKKNTNITQTPSASEDTSDSD